MKYLPIIRILEHSIQSIDLYNEIYFPNDPFLVPPIKGVKKIIFCKIFREIYDKVNKKTIDNFIQYNPEDEKYCINITTHEGATCDINEHQLIKLIIDSILFIYIRLETTDTPFVEFNNSSFLTDDDELEKVYTNLVANMANYILSIPGLPAKIQQLMKNYQLPTMVNIPIYEYLPIPPGMLGGKKTKNRKRKRMSNKSVKKIHSIRKYKRRNTNNSNKK
jgi:hypothetical protein